MAHKDSNFGAYLCDIMEHGEYDSQADAAQAIGISTTQFSKILNGKRVTVSWDTGVRIVRRHVAVMERIVSDTV